MVERIVNAQLVRAQKEMGNILLETGRKFLLYSGRKLSETVSCSYMGHRICK